MDTPDALRDYLGEMFGQIGERFDRVDERFDRVDERLGRVDERLDRVDERMDGLERKVDQRFSEIETVTNALVDAVADINKKLNESG